MQDSRHDKTDRQQVTHTYLRGRRAGGRGWGGARRSLEGGSCSGIGTQLGGSRGLGKRAWPGRRRPAVLPARCVWPSVRPGAVGCLDDSKRPPKKGPRTSSPARPGLPLAWSRGNGAPPHGQAITNQLRLLYYRATDSRAMTTCTPAPLPPAHTAEKTHIYVAARLDPDGRLILFLLKASIWNP